MMPPQPPKVIPDDLEPIFREWYRHHAKGLDPDPDSPLHQYDYRGAFAYGDAPKVDPSDGLPHWRSAFKGPGHPNRFVDGRDTRADDRQSMGKPLLVSLLGLKRQPADNTRAHL